MRKPRKIIIIGISVVLVIAAGALIYLKFHTVSADVIETQKPASQDNLIEVKTNYSQEQLDQMSSQDQSNTIDTLVNSKVSATKVTQTKSLEPEAFLDGIVIVKTKDGADYYSKGLSKAGSSVASNFNFGPGISDQTKQLLFDIYPKVLSLYGPRDSSDVLGVDVLNPADQYQAYFNPSNKTLMVKQVVMGDPAALAHELMHAFHSNHILYTKGGLWEEGMATAGALILYPDSTRFRFYVQSGSFMIENQNFPYNSREDFESLSNLSIYYYGSAFFYKLYLENPDSFKRFNFDLYQTDLGSSTQKDTNAALAALLTKSTSTLEGQTIYSWISKNNAFADDFVSVDRDYYLSIDKTAVLTQATTLDVTDLTGPLASGYKVVVKDLNDNVLKSSNQSIQIRSYANYSGVVKIEVAPASNPSAIHSAYEVKINGSDPGFTTYGASLSGGDIATIKDIATSRIEYSRIVNGMFKFTDAMNKDGKFVISIYKKTPICNLAQINTSCLGSIVSTRTINRIKTNQTFGLSDKYLIIMGQPANCTYSISRNNTNKKQVTITSTQKCGKTIVIDDFDIIRFWGTSHTYNFDTFGLKNYNYQAFSAFSNETSGQQSSGVLVGLPTKTPTRSQPSPVPVSSLTSSTSVSNSPTTPSLPTPSQTP